MKDIKDNVCEVNEKDDYDKIIEQSLTTMKTISKILNDAIIFCNMIANRSKKVEDNIEDGNYYFYFLYYYYYFFFPN